MEKLVSIQQAKELLQKQGITFLDGYCYEKHLSNTFKPVTKELRQINDFLEKAMLPQEYAQQLEAEYEAIPVFESIEAPNGVLMAYIHFDDGQEKWIAL